MPVSDAELRKRAEAVSAHAVENWGTYGVYDNMVYARAASPAVVLALLDRIDELESKTIALLKTLP